MRSIFLLEAGALQTTAHLHYYQNIHDLISVSREKQNASSIASLKLFEVRKKYFGILKKRR
jgi:hypothetical protein